MNTKILKNDAASIQEAAEIIKNGGLLGIPTETVYGLGANALNEEAVKHIFEAKGRPQDNPLIIHVPNASWLTRYCKNIPEKAYQLAELFWPGPLTMILERKEIVPLRTTGGLETVGVRCPNHPLTLKVIETADVPIAAPSGNTSGRPSPTSMEAMLEDMDGKIDAIMDGGTCGVGVESTIIDLTSPIPRLLRPGGLPLEALEAVLGEITIDQAVKEKIQEGTVVRAPGMKYTHYAPKAPVTVVKGNPMLSSAYMLMNMKPTTGIICFDEFAPLFAGHVVERLGSVDDLKTQAQRVFAALRSFDHTEVENIIAQCPEEYGLGLAIANRLTKAAGFDVVDMGRPFIIGITGPTGAGKSSALKAIDKMGGLTLDLDEIYHQMMEKETPLHQAVAETFPEAFADSKFDRKVLSGIVFQNKEKMALLDGLVDTYMTQEIRHRIHATTANVVALDGIKILESHLKDLCDRTVGILAPEKVRLERIMARDGITKEQALARIRAQKNDEYYRENCTDILENKGDAATFEETAYAYFTILMKEG